MLQSVDESSPAAPRRSPWQLVALALLAALPLLVPWNGRHYDIDSYYTWASRLFAGEVPYRDFPFEYPPASLLLFALPRLVAHDAKAYAVAFIVCMWLADVVQKWLLWRLCGPRRGALAVAVHSACGAILYFTYLKRFDVALTTVMLVAWLSAWKAPRSLRPWAWWALGVLIKLVPVFLAPLLVARTWRRRSPWQGLGRALAGLGMAIGALALTALWAGPAAWSWVTYHQARGIHVGSTYTALHALHQGLGRPLTFDINYGAAHMTGAWTQPWVHAAPALMVLGVLFTWLRMAPHMHHEAAHWRAAAATLVVILLTNKVFSPQFAAWVVPFVIAAAVRSERLDGPLLAGLLAVAGLTGEIFPGEGALLSGALHKQGALVGRSMLLLAMWLYMLATPRGLLRGQRTVEGGIQL